MKQAQHTGAIEPEVLYGYADLKQRNIVCSRPTLHRWLKHGHFPHPHRYPSGRLAWKGSDLIEFLEKVAAR